MSAVPPCLVSRHLDSKQHWESYFKALKGGDIRYERIVQGRNMQAPEHAGAGTCRRQNMQAPEHGSEDLLSFPWVIGHLKECVKLGKAGKKAGVYKAPPAIMLSFVLIDKRFLLLQLDESTGDGHARFARALVIHDDYQGITGAFDQIFWDLRLRSSAWDLRDLTKAHGAPS